MEAENKANILVVDDNPVKRLAVASVLEDLNQNIVTAESGQDALRALLSLECAVILMDVQMPAMDGFETAKLIRTREQSESTPIIFITSYSHAETDMIGGYSLGAVDFIFAPIIPEILRAKVSVFVDLFHKTQVIKRHEQHLGSLVEQRTAALTAEIAERKRAEVEIRKLSSAVEKAADSIFITDTNGVIEYVNPAFEKITGYRYKQAVGGTPRLLKSEKHEQAFYRKIWDTLIQGKIYRDILINRKKSGQLYHEEITITPVANEQGTVTHYISSGRDITERMQTQERLYRLAHNDLLTEMPNRALFVDHLTQALSRAKWNQRAVAVLFIDLDRFKLVNDTLGHEAGDRLLQAISARLLPCVREGDTIARFGGDEFSVLLNDIASPHDVAPVARKLLESLMPPFVIDDHEFFITGSIGIGLYPDDGTDTRTLMKNADTAMYQAKQQGGNAYKFYRVDMNAHALKRLQLETDLRRALERQEFVLHYQPQFDLNGSGIVGLEALLRWQRSGSELVPPMEFIPLLEETGLIVPVSEWVLRTACAQRLAWEQAGLPPLRMAVNLSGRQFGRADLVETISRVMQDAQLQPGFLELEITESILMENVNSVVEILQTLRAMGVRFAIDDFGTGYSSLSYLKRFPIDILKIDKAFVHDVTIDADDAAIVSAIIRMAHSLGIKVIAEGVETRKQLAFLRAQGCDFAQGFYFSRPQPADEIGRLLRKESSSGPTRGSESRSGR